MRQISFALLAGAVLAFADPPGASVQVGVKVPPGLATGVFATQRSVTVPPGFQISVWARLSGARFMALAPNGDVFVSQPGAGAVYALRTGPDGASTSFPFVTGLSNPHGLAFDQIGGQWFLYVAESSQIDRFTYSPGETTARDRKVLVTGLPDGSTPGLGGGYSHPLKNIAVAPDHRLYVGIGSSCNVCAGDATADPVRGSVYVYNADGTNGRLFARGLRNAEGLAFVPGTGTLWAAVNNRDQLPYPYQDSTNQYGRVVSGYVDDHPPEPFTQVREGGNYGWPFCNPTQDGATGFENMAFDLDLDTNKSGAVNCSAMDRVSRGLQAHSAPLQFTFAQRTGFPEVYRDGAVVALHGSWNRSVPTGYKVIYLPWRAVKGQPGEPMDLVTGFADFGARPAGVLISASGSLLISDDATGTIYELSYAAPVVSGASSYAWLAPGSFASFYGNGLGSSTDAAVSPYPETLGGVAVNVVDAAGHSFSSGLSFVSPRQINFVLPEEVSAGTATVSVTRGGQPIATSPVQVKTSAPGLFSLNGMGNGAAAATASDSEGKPVPVFSCSASACDMVPIDVTGASKYLSLYGTGIRGGAKQLQVKIDDTFVPVTFAGAQGTYPGLDQVNVSLPAALAGKGVAEVQVAVGGLLSNTVTVAIR